MRDSIFILHVLFCFCSVWTDFCSGAFYFRLPKTSRYASLQTASLGMHVSIRSSTTFQFFHSILHLDFPSVDQTNRLSPIQSSSCLITVSLRFSCRRTLLQSLDQSWLTLTMLPSHYGISHCMAPVTETSHYVYLYPAIFLADHFSLLYFSRSVKREIKVEIITRVYNESTTRVYNEITTRVYNEITTRVFFLSNWAILTRRTIIQPNNSWNQERHISRQSIAKKAGFAPSSSKASTHSQTTICNR